MSAALSSLRRRLAAEDGYVVAVTAMMLAIGLLLATAAAIHGVATTDTAIRDLRERQAMAAAQAGLDTAVHRLNMLSTDARVALGVPVAQQCLVNVGNQLNVGNLVGSTCPPISGDLGNRESYSYVVNALPTLPAPCLLTCTQTISLDRRIVVTGSVGCPGSGCVQRRIAADVHAQITRRYLLSLGVTLLNSASLTLFTPGGRVECTAQPPVPSNPFSGC
jgi:hypothetical protein